MSDTVLIWIPLTTICFEAFFGLHGKLCLNHLHHFMQSAKMLTGLQIRRVVSQ
jgi:hypothetical protein